MAIRLVLVSIVAAIAVGALAVFTVGDISAGAAPTVTVGSLANTTSGPEGFGDCEADVVPTPGDCTLAEAINFANAGNADVINFHKTVFSKQSPGVIFIDDAVPGNEGCLPTITVEVTIDSTNTGVILDGDANNDFAAQDCSFDDQEGVIQVDAAHNGFDFTFLGGKNFIIREFDGDTDGIMLDGDNEGGPFSFGDVEITGLVFHDGDVSDEVDEYDSEDGIDTADNTNIVNGLFTNNNITADDDGIELEANGVCAEIGGQVAGQGNPEGCKLGNSSIEISGNTVVADFDADGGGDAVEVDYDADLNGKITLQVIENDSLTSLGDEAVDIEYCDGTDCSAGGGSFNIWVNDNAKFHGDDDGVEIDIFADDGPPNSGSVDVDIQVNNNGLTDADGDDGIDINVDVARDTSFSTSSIQVNGNDDIIGDDDGVVIDADIGCGDGNESTVEVIGNGRIEGQDDDGVDINNEAGEQADDCDFESTESDENTATVRVNDNGRINGGGGEGIEIDNFAGSDDEPSADDNVTHTEVVGNARIDGEDDGIEIDTLAGTADGDDGDDNTATVIVEGNDDVRGRNDEAVDIDASTGVGTTNSGDGPDSVYTGGDGSDGDVDTTEVFVRDNGSLEGGDGDGVDIDAQAGGGHASSIGNAVTVEVTGNAEIFGTSSSGGAAVDVDFNVCCDSANTNTLTIANNGDLTGFDSDAIDLDFCCSVNIATIVDNGAIRGNDGDGIKYRVDITSDADPTDPAPCPSECGLFSSVNMLTISGNDIFNSEDNGISICCGAFQLPTDSGRDDEPVLKSLITNNTIHHNRDHGIEINSSFGLNIVGNEIFSNGDDPQVDRGIEIDSDDTADSIRCGGAGCAALDAIVEGTSARQNRISQNSIYDNVGMGIELIGDLDQNGDGDHAIGCVIFGGIPSPNDCLPFPVIQTLSADKLVGDACAGCLVELFEADATPADQLPLGEQHGEGRTFITSGEADDLGDWSITLPCGMGDLLVTATATDKLKNTSEFSRNFQVLGIPCTPTPTNTPTATDTPVPPTNTPVPPTDTPSAKVCGDVNMDGVANSVDASLILQLKADLISSLANESSADVNNDGAITSVDAALILQFTAGLIGADALNCP